MKCLIESAINFLKIRYLIFLYIILSISIPPLYVFTSICSIKKISRAWNGLNLDLIPWKAIQSLEVICLGKCIKNSYISYTAFFIKLLYDDLYPIFKNSPSIITIILLSLLSLLLLVANKLLGECLSVYYFLSDWGLTM